MCGRGHLRKDTDWSAPRRADGADNGDVGSGAEDGRKKKNGGLKRSVVSSASGAVSLSLGSKNLKSLAASSSAAMTSSQLLNGLRYRANSLSSTGSSASSGSSSPPEVVSSAGILLKRRANQERER